MNLRSKTCAATLAITCLFGLPLPGQGAETRSTVPSTNLAEARRVAPNFVGISNWLNSSPLNIAALRGKVVLIDFWTSGCINCARTLPYVTGLYDKYKGKGLVVVGVHTPEFPFERSTATVQAAIAATASVIRLPKTTNLQHGRPIGMSIDRLRPPPP